MANTVWKGQLTFGLVSFPVRLVRAARKDRIPLRYVREMEPSQAPEEPVAPSFPPSSREWSGSDQDERRPAGNRTGEVAFVRQAYLADQADHPVAAHVIQRGYEVAPGQFAVVRSEELRRLRQPTSQAMEILRSVHMDEIDPLFLETSYYILPGNGGEHSYSLFYGALKDTGYASLAEVAMHGRQHVVVIRPGAKGLIAHTMYYVNEVLGTEEHSAEARDVAPKELDLARRFVEAIAAPFKPEEFTDRYREQLELLIASKKTVSARDARPAGAPTTAKVVDIMDALRKSLEAIKKPAARAEGSTAAARTAGLPRKTRASR